MTQTHFFEREKNAELEAKSQSGWVIRPMRGGGSTFYQAVKLEVAYSPRRGGYYHREVKRSQPVRGREAAQDYIDKQLAS